MVIRGGWPLSICSQFQNCRNSVRGGEGALAFFKPNCDIVPNVCVFFSDASPYVYTINQIDIKDPVEWQTSPLCWEFCPKTTSYLVKKKSVVAKTTRKIYINLWWIVFSWNRQEENFWLFVFCLKYREEPLQPLFLYN